MRRVFLWLLYSGFGRPFLKVIVGVQFPVLRELRKEPQFILVANHNSHLDTATLLAAMPSSILHQVHPVAAADHFGKNPWQARLTRFCVNALLIPRKRDTENPFNDPINIMLAELDAGGSLILFPEGTRGEPETLQRFKKGVGLVLSQRPAIPYIPVFMDGLGKAMPKGDNLILPHPARLYFGVPTRVTSTDPDLITEQVERDVLALRPPTGPREQ